MLARHTVTAVENGRPALTDRLETLLRNDKSALANLRRGGHAMNELADMIEKFMTAASNVLVLGESLSSGETMTPADMSTELGLESPCSGVRRTGEPGGEPAALSPCASCWANLERATLAFQRDHIARVLDAADGNREAAAKLLGLSPATLYRYLQKVGLKGYGHG